MWIEYVVPSTHYDLAQPCITLVEEGQESEHRARRRAYGGTGESDMGV